MDLEPPQLLIIREQSGIIEPRVVAIEDEYREIPGLDLPVNHVLPHDVQRIGFRLRQ